jgi:hypothetical protein
MCVNFKTMVEPGLPVMKLKKGKPLTSAENRRVLNIFTEVSEDNPHIALDAPLKR